MASFNPAHSLNHVLRPLGIPFRFCLIRIRSSATAGERWAGNPGPSAGDGTRCPPPSGLNLFVLSGLTGASVLSIARHAVPYVLILLIVVPLLAFIPRLSLWAL